MSQIRSQTALHFPRPFCRHSHAFSIVFGFFRTIVGASWVNKEDDRQKPYSSGKKKCQTLKNEMAVQPDGTIGAVSASVPGGAVDDLMLQRQRRLVAQWDPEEEAALVDKGYDGIGKD